MPKPQLKQSRASLVPSMRSESGREKDNGATGFFCGSEPLKRQFLAK